MEFACYQCGKPLTGMILPVSRREECAHCRAEVHCCRMCVHYRKDRHQWCAEDRAEPPSSQQVANFCEYFSPSSTAFGDKHSDSTKDALDQLSSLFED
ncbi:MAG: hypothetical protein AB8B96_22170 [Lysobacterales bacterium]